ncbi:MAG TPA: transketolase C-terminal domain-containing protein, partial [Rubrivivax sp.]|nr:transketolase C-terminal domain-containing protein [Rubrivivax sp.]
PSDENECRQALTTAFRQDHAVAVRYPRGVGVGAAIEDALTAWPWGRGVVRRSGQRLAVLAFGTLLHPALQAAEKLGCTVADMRFVKPLDEALVLELARSHEGLITVEEGCVMGGAGSAVLECLAAAGVQVPVLQLGLPDRFVEHGDAGKLLALCGLDAAGIEASILKRFGSRISLAAVNA